MNDQTEPIRKGLLPCTPPPEWEFHTVFGARTGTEGCALFPGDAGPVVVRRRVSYGDWEPVRPDRWAAEPETDARAAAPAVPAPATDRETLRQRIAEALIEWTYRGKNPEHGGILETVRANAYSRADAVLAVLPATVDRAAVYRELAEEAAEWGGVITEQELQRKARMTDQGEPAREAQQDPTQDGEFDVVRRETVEYFVQAQQPDGSWEQCSSTATDREFATERVAARRRMQPGFTYRIAERTTAVVVRAVAEDTTPPV